MEQSKVGVATKGKCQQLCFATPRLKQMKSPSSVFICLMFKSTLLRCNHFTFFEKKTNKGKNRCGLFKKCLPERRRRFDILLDSTFYTQNCH